MPHRLIAAHKAHQEAADHIKDYVKENHPEMANQLDETPSGHEPAPESSDSHGSDHEVQDKPSHGMKQKRPAKFGGMF